MVFSILISCIDVAHARLFGKLHGAAYMPLDTQHTIHEYDDLQSSESASPLQEGSPYEYLLTVV